MIEVHFLIRLANYTYRPCIIRADPHYRLVTNNFPVSRG